MLSIVVLNYKNPPLLRLCLKSLKRTLSPEFSHEIIVIDSASTPETKFAATEEFPHCRPIPFRENTGYTRGINEGIKASRGKYCLILNPDIMPRKGAIEKMVNYLDAHPEIGLLGPKLLNLDGSRQHSCFRWPTLLTVLCRRMTYLPFAQKILDRFTMADSLCDKPIAVCWLMGSAILARRAAFEKIGLMDERFFLYFSDVDWPRRFWENGYKVFYYPEAEMHHAYHRDSKGRFGVLDIFFRKETRWHITDAFRYFKKHGLMPPTIKK